MSSVAREELMTVVTPVRGETMALEFGETDPGGRGSFPGSSSAEVEDEAGETDVDCLRLMLLDNAVSPGCISSVKDIITGES